MGIFDPVLAYEPDVIDKKKADLSKASFEKKAALSSEWAKQELNDALLNDADSYQGGTNPKGQRFSSPNDLTNYDSFEDSVTKWKNNPENRASQAIAAGEILGKPASEVSNQDIFGLNEQSRNRASDILFEGQENFFTDNETAGPVRPNDSESGMPVMETNFQKLGHYGRDIVQARNPITGKVVSEELNNPIDNAAFNSIGRFGNKAGRDAYDQTPAGREAILEGTDRTAGEVAGDVGAMAGKFGVNTGATAYGIGDITARTLMQPINAAAKQIDKILPDWMKTGYTLGQDELAGNFAETNKIIDETLQSDQTKLSVKKKAAADEEWNAGSEARKKKWVDEGKLTGLGAEVVDMTMSIYEGAKNSLDNPLALQDIVGTSLPQLATGGIFGKAAVSKTIANKTSNMTSKEASKYVTSKEGKKLIDSVATRTGIATEAVQESMINAVNKQGEVLAMSEAELGEGSNEYVALRSNGMSHEQARQEIANKTFNTTMAVTAAISSGASKFMGTGKATGKLLLGADGSPITDGIVKKTAKGALDLGKKTVGETGQEIVQEGGGEFAGNLAEKLFVNEDQKLLEGVGTAAGTGGIAGGVTGGGMHAAGDTAKALGAGAGLGARTAGKVAGSDTGKKVTEQVKKTTGAVKDFVAGKKETTKDFDVNDATTVKDYDSKDPYTSAKLVNNNTKLTPEAKAKELEKSYESLVKSATDNAGTNNVAAQSYIKQAREVAELQTKNTLNDTAVVNGDTPIDETSQKNLMRNLMGNAPAYTKEEQKNLDSILKANPEFANKYNTMSSTLAKTRKDIDMAVASNGTKTAKQVMNEIATDVGQKLSLTQHLDNAMEAYASGDTAAISATQNKVDSWMATQQKRLNEATTARDIYNDPNTPQENKEAGIPIGKSKLKYGGGYGAKRGDSLISGIQQGLDTIQAVSTGIRELTGTAQAPAQTTDNNIPDYANENIPLAEEFAPTNVTEESLASEVNAEGPVSAADLLSGKKSTPTVEGDIPSVEQKVRNDSNLDLSDTIDLVSDEASKNNLERLPLARARIDTDKQLLSRQIRLKKEGSTSPSMIDLLKAVDYEVNKRGLSTKEKTTSLTEEEIASQDNPDGPVSAADLLTGKKKTEVSAPTPTVDTSKERKSEKVSNITQSITQGRIDIQTALDTVTNKDPESNNIGKETLKGYSDYSKEADKAVRYLGVIKERVDLAESKNKSTTKDNNNDPIVVEDKINLKTKTGVGKRRYTVKKINDDGTLTLETESGKISKSTPESNNVVIENFVSPEELMVKVNDLLKITNDEVISFLNKEQSKKPVTVSDAPSKKIEKKAPVQEAVHPVDKYSDKGDLEANYVLPASVGSLTSTNIQKGNSPLALVGQRASNIYKSLTDTKSKKEFVDGLAALNTENFTENASEYMNSYEMGKGTVNNASTLKEYNTIDPKTYDNLSPLYVENENDSKEVKENKKAMRDNVDAAIAKQPDINDVFVESTSDTDGSLSEYPNALAILNEGGQAADTLIKNLELTPEDIKFLTSEEFTSIVDMVKNNINDSILKAKYKSDVANNPLLLMTDADGRLPSNVVEAMAISGAMWLAGRSTETLTNDKQDINRMLGLDWKAKNPTGSPKVLSHIGKSISGISQDLGTNTISSLGLQFSKDLDANFGKTMQQAIGNQIVIALHNSENLVTISNIPQGYLNELKESDEVDDNKKPETYKEEQLVHFIKLFTNDNGSVPDSILTFFDTIKAGKSSVDKLLGEQNNTKDVLSEPKKTVPKKLQGTPMLVAQNFGNNVKNVQKHSYESNPTLMTVYNSIDRQIFSEMAGAPSVQEIADANKDQQDSLEAKRDSVLEDMNRVNDFNADDAFANKPFWLPYSIWVNYRMGVDTNTINPQASKIHRFLFGASSWKNTINLGTNNPVDKAHLEQLKIAIGQGLGIDVDKQQNSVSVKHLDAIYNETDNFTDTPKGNAARTAHELLNELKSTGSLPLDKQKELLKAVKVFKENIHSLAALQTLSDYVNAVDGKDKEFTFSLPKEVDGVTNGTANSMLQYAPFNEDYKNKMNAVGMYFNGDTEQDYLTWRGLNGQGNIRHKDLYESLGDLLNKALGNHNSFLINGPNPLLDPSSDELASYVKQYKRELFPLNKALPKGQTKLSAQMQAIGNIKLNSIQALMVDFDRKFAKDPLLTFSYMAGVPTIADNKAKDFYTNLQDTSTELLLAYVNAPADNNLAQWEAFNEYQNHINNLTLSYDGTNSGNTTVNKKGFDALKNEDKVTLAKNLYSELAHQEAGNKDHSHRYNYIRTMMKNYMTPIMEEALDSEYGEMKVIREKFINMANVLNLMFKDIEQVNLKKLYDKKDKDGNKIVVSKEALDAMYDDMIKKGQMMTFMAPMSEDKKNHSDSMLISKTDTELVSEADGGRVTNRSAKDSIGVTKIRRSNNSLSDPNINQSKQSQIGSQINKKIYSEDIGVKLLVLLIISQDANTNNLLMGKHPVLNIHDATMGDILNIFKRSQDYNDGHQQTVDNWSLATELARTMKTMTAQHNNVFADSANKSEYESKLREALAQANDMTLDKVNELGASNADLLADMITDTNELTTEVNAQKDLRKGSITAYQNFPNSGQDAATNNANVSAVSSAKPTAQGATPGAQSNTASRNPKNDIDGNSIKNIFTSMANSGNVQENAVHHDYLQSYIDDVISPALDGVARFQFTLEPSATSDVNEGHFNFIENEVFIAPSTKAKKGSQGGMLNGITIDMSAEEILAHEMTHAIWKNIIDNNPELSNNVQKQYLLAKKGLTAKYGKGKEYKGMIPKDLKNPSPQDTSTAEKLYDYVFNNTEKIGYLHEFGSYALTNEALMDELKGMDANPSKDYSGKNIFYRLMGLLANGIRWINGVVLGTNDKNVQQAMTQLVKDTTAVQNQAKGRLNKTLNTIGYAIEKINDRGAQYLTETVFPYYTKKADQYVQRDSYDGVLAGIGRIAMLPVLLPYYANSGQFRNDWSKLMREGFGLTKGNPVYNLLYEMRTIRAIDRPFHELGRLKKQMVDSYRQDTKTSITNMLTESFDSKNRPTEAEWLAINSGFLKVDASSLIDNVNNKQEFTDLHELMTNSSKRDMVIKALKTEIKNLAVDKYAANKYFNQLDSLGHYMAQGTVGIDQQYLNTSIIAMMGNQQENADLIAKMERLGSLHAISYTDQKTLNTAAEVMKREMSRELPAGTENGIEMLIGQHKIFKEDSLKRNFNGDPMLTIKGYTKEKYDDQRSWKVATKKDGEDLLRQGYTLQGAVPRADLDTGTKNELFLYVSKDGLVNEYVSGLSSLSSTQARGTNLIETYLESDPSQPIKNAIKDLNDFTSKSIKSSMRQGKGNITNFTKNYMIPSIDANNQIKNYRYVMSEQNKVELLGKKDLANEVMGSMFGDIIEKERSIEFNQKALDLIEQDILDNYVGNEADYEKISKGDELYDVLPTSTKIAIQKQFGSESLPIRTEVKDLILGYRKFSLTNSLQKSYPGTSPVLLKTMRIAGQLWQYIVSKAKRNIVILTPAVLIGNMISNIALLTIKGVPPQNIYRDMKRALKGIMKYDRDADRSKRLRARIKANPNNPNIIEMRQQLRELELDIKRNPVKELVDAGVFQTIAEDINPQDTKRDRIISNISNKAGANLDKLEGYIPEVAKGAYKYAVISQDTNIGSVLAKATQYSDFLARYALYEHQTKKKGMDKKDSINDILDTFIDYDNPTGVYMQYANDMGLLMYTKFLFRIQRVIANILTTRPASVAAMELAQIASGNDFSDITDSNLIGALGIDRFNNPVDIIQDAYTWNLLNWVPFAR